MNQESSKIKSFTDLRAWQLGHRLILEIYRISQLFPKEEQFGLTSQLRRATVSITSNMAEGFSRNSYKEKAQFYTTALGSLSEVQNQLLIAHDIEYFASVQFDTIARQTMEVSKVTNGLIKSSRLIHNS